MTKTIETLKRPYPKDDALYDHIANTYFHQKSKPKSKHKTGHLPVKQLTRLAIALAIVALFVVSASALTTLLYNQHLDAMKKEVAISPIINIITNDNINKEIIGRFEFRGSAREGNSRIAQDAIILNTPKKYTRADIAIDFKFPIDLSARYLSLSLRGEKGGERINIVLRDTSDKSCSISDLYLTSNWKENVLHLGSMKKEIDLRNIKHMRIESGYTGESAKEKDSPINFTVYVKNLSAYKEAGL